MTPRSALRRRDERGAFLIIWALLAIALFAMVAIVVDLGQLRDARRDNQSIADLAALAAGQNLGNARPQQACQDAWSYLLSNARDMPTGVTSPCSTVPVACPSPIPPLVARTFTRAAPPYTVTITYPVTNADIADPKFGGVGDNDGEVCQRMRVTVKRDLDAFFAGVINQRDLTTSASAVVRSNRINPTDKPSLWLLEPAACNSLTTSGGGSVEVGSVLPVLKPGYITVDSAGTGPGCGNTISSGGSSHIHAIPASGSPAGTISLFALPLNLTCNDAPNACNQGDVSSGRISPAPVNRPARATRSPVDWQFNCKNDGDGNGATSIYPDYRTSPLVQIPDCPHTARPAYIDALRAYVGTSGVPTSGVWQTWAPGRSCSPPVGVTIAPAGNWLVNCPGGFNIGNGSVVQFNGNVIFDGPVNVGNGGTLSVNANNPTPTMGPACAPADPDLTPPQFCGGSSSQKAAWVYMRSGNLDVRANLFLNKTTLYQHNGFINIIAGALPIWTSPDEGGFTGLALWNEKPSNSSTDFQLLGGGAMQLEGTFFVPEAKPLRLRGGGLQNALQAQFIANSLDVGGNGVLSLDPLTNKGVSIDEPTGILIR